MFPMKLPTTLQEFFNNAWRWAVIEKHPQCSSANLYCKYRMNSNACLIGCSIPEDLYEPDMENKSAKTVLAEFFGVTDMHILQSINQLQAIHDDNIDNYDTVAVRLRDYAREYRLTVPEAD